MDVLVDTSIWSLAFRRKASPLVPPEVLELKQLIIECRARIIGPVRQELLSGIAHSEQYESLKDKLRAFPDIPLETGYFERAAEMFNQCRKVGIQGAHVDFVICAVAKGHAMPVFTSDRDFEHYDRILGIPLYRPRIPLTD